jgi:signal transduction histidine kinase
MPSFTASDSEELVASLAHDLRQPLGTIETSAYCLNLLLGQEHNAAREQLRIIERQVSRAVRILNEAVGETRHHRDRPAKTAAAS